MVEIGVDSPSTSKSLYWSNTVILKLPVGMSCELERAIRFALGEVEVRAVRIAQAHVALRVAVAVVRAAAVYALVRRAAHARGRDLAVEVGAAAPAVRHTRKACAHLMIAGLAKPIATW